jgi:hypothetical protein
MDDLSKQQLILLGLLVSFVTSLATGIVTVSLMNQSPSVTRTINQIVERTIENVAPQDAAVASTPTFKDQTTAAVDAVSQSLIKLAGSDGTVGGLGLVVSKSGVIVADKSSVAGLSGYRAIFSDGRQSPIAIIQSQTNGDIVFLAPMSPAKTAYTPISLASEPELGQSVFSLSGTSTAVLGQGMVTVLAASSSPVSPVIVSIPAGKTTLGSPLFDINGNVIGLRTSSLTDNDGTAFYPMSDLESVIRNFK